MAKKQAATNTESSALKKSKTVTDDSDESKVLKYLETNNRPYSAVDIFNNLHGAVGKTALTKVLTSMVDRKVIQAKAYGKQWVYVARQDTAEAPSEDILVGMDQDITRLKEEVQLQKESTKAMQSRLNILQNTYTTQVAKSKLNSTKDSIEQAKKKLSLLRSGEKRVDPIEKKRVDAEFEKITKEWKKRRRYVMDAIGTITEASGQKPRAFMEELEMDLAPDPI